MLINAIGQGCPKPVMMADEELMKMSEGIVEVLVDNEASADNLVRFAGKKGFYNEKRKEGDHWKVKIVKGYVCVAPSDAEKKEGKELFLIVATDAMGKEEYLGRILMKAFFETMKTYKELPHTIFFMNAGVKLTTTDGEIVSILKEIEAMGVEIYSCGTCLKHYGLESDLNIGHRGTTNHVVEGIKDFGKTVWIG
ncbi:MAG: sulfurtransferase-like selenium metabolism protein YedF [Nitrospirota bacterium]